MRLHLFNIIAADVVDIPGRVSGNSAHSTTWHLGHLSSSDVCLKRMDEWLSYSLTLYTCGPTSFVHHISPHISSISARNLELSATKVLRFAVTRSLAVVEVVGPSTLAEDGSVGTPVLHGALVEVQQVAARLVVRLLQLMTPAGGAHACTAYAPLLPSKRKGCGQPTNAAHWVYVWTCTTKARSANSARLDLFPDLGSYMSLAMLALESVSKESMVLQGNSKGTTMHHHRAPKRGTHGTTRTWKHWLVLQLCRQVRRAEAVNYGLGRDAASAFEEPASQQVILPGLRCAHTACANSHTCTLSPTKRPANKRRMDTRTRRTPNA